jgi:hypothetical protein
VGVQPIVILTDHKSLENWTTEMLETPTGPSGRRARWHVLFSHFDLHILYVPGSQNVVADSMSRWAYPVGPGLRDTSIHGSTHDAEETKKIIQQERQEEKTMTEAHTQKVGVLDTDIAVIAPVATRLSTRRMEAIVPPRLGEEPLTPHSHSHTPTSEVLEVPGNQAPVSGYPGLTASPCSPHAMDNTVREP